MEEKKVEDEKKEENNNIKKRDGWERTMWKTRWKRRIVIIKKD